MYTSEIKKYDDNLTKSLSYKFIIFMNIYKRVEVPEEILHIAFLIILKSMALEYYYSSYSIKLII